MRAERDERGNRRRQSKVSDYRMEGGLMEWGGYLMEGDQTDELPG